MKQKDPALFMMIKGMKINENNLDRARDRAKAELELVEQKLADCSEVPFNPSSPKQCIEYFYGVKKIKPYLHHKTKKPTTDDMAMTRIARRDNLPEARLVQDYRRLKKLIGSYLDMVYDKDARLRCFYNIRGTTTGRYSSSKTVFQTGMNMQNLHPIFKHMLEADSDEDNKPLHELWKGL